MNVKYTIIFKQHATVSLHFSENTHQISWPFPEKHMDEFRPLQATSKVT
jgi:hypothetical protein